LNFVRGCFELDEKEIEIGVDFQPYRYSQESFKSSIVDYADNNKYR
jgi:hypothetical protein